MPLLTNNIALYQENSLCNFINFPQYWLKFILWSYEVFSAFIKRSLCYVYVSLMYIFIYYSCFISFIVVEVYFNHQRQLQMPLKCTCMMCMLSVHILLMSIFISFCYSQQSMWDVITESAGLWRFKGADLYTLCSVLWLLLLWSGGVVHSPMYLI